MTCKNCREDETGMCDSCANEELKKLNAAPEINVKPSEVELLRAENLSLVSENEALKQAIPKPKEIDFHDDRLDDVSVAEQVGFNHAISTIRKSMQETPATDSFTAELRAQGADAVAEYHKVRVDALIDVDRKGANEHKVSYMAARDVAANLRAGRNG